MDSKSDDSAGSDSLDKTLQQKCVVDDVGQGEGIAEATKCLTASSGATTHNDERDEIELTTDIQPDSGMVLENSTTSNYQKTMNSMGDGEGGNGSSSAFKGNILAKHGKAQQPDAECNSDDGTTQNTETTNLATTSSTSKNNNAFETKVKQISQNLRETSLAETAIHTTECNAFASTISSSSSSSSSPSTALECEMTGSDGINTSDSCSSLLAAAGSSNQCSDVMDNSMTSLNDSMDDQDQRSKKVRFHPDVKENDGGNRVIPKKKKKFKSTTGTGDDAGASCSQRNANADDEMELDDEDDEDDQQLEEEEEEFNLARTIAEAKDYLKDHPLTFVRPTGKNAGLIHNGLLEEEDLSQLSESSEDEDIYDQVPSENGVKCILGKQTKLGKIEFLLRYAERPGIFWETEDFICKNCPNLLNTYEHNRERRQERLMRHVAKRQNLRQRYTDF